MGISTSVNSEEFAVDVEGTPGTAETAPAYYILANKRGGSITTERTFNFLTPANGYTAAIPKPGPYHSTLRIGSWAIPDANGFGTLLTAAIGADAKTNPSGTAYLHTITPTDVLPSLTVWAKPKNTELKMTYAQVRTFTIRSPHMAPVEWEAEIIGGRTVQTSDFGSATYASESDAEKLFASPDLTLTFGQAGAAVRTNVTDITININNGHNPDEGKVHGQYYANSMLAGRDREYTATLKFWDEDAEEMQRYWEGVDTDPTATEPAETPGLVAFTAKWQSALITGAYYYYLQVGFPKAQITNFAPGRDGNRLSAEVTLKAVRAPHASNIPIEVYLENTENDDYDVA